MQFSMGRLRAGVVLLPFIALAAGADPMNVNVNFGGGNGGSNELNARRACLKYIGEGKEICEKKNSGDCNKYAFVEDESLYACQDDKFSGVCRKKLAWTSFIPCPDDSLAYGDMQKQVLALEQDKAEDRRRRQEWEAAEQLAEYEYEVEEARRQEEEARRQEEQQEMKMKIAAGLLVATVIVTLMYWDTVITVFLEVITACVLGAVAYGIGWAYDEFQDEFQPYGEMSIIAGAGVPSIYLAIKLLIWCNKGPSTAEKKLKAP